MDNILRYLAKNALSAVMVTIVTGLTLTTSAAGTVKLLGSINSVKTTVPEVKDVQALDSEISKTPTPTVIKKTKTVAAVVGNLLNKISPTLVPTLAPTTASINSAQNNNSCIISLFGKQYDVFPLQSTHSGGNIFKCNTDMTTTYQGKHGTDVSRMQKYLLASTGGTTNNSGGGTSGSNGSVSEPTPTGSSSGSETEIKTENHRENDDDREDRGEDDDEKHIENENEEDQL